MARRKLVEIVNRTTEPLDAMYDGTPEVIPAGYKNIGTEEKPEIVGAGNDGAPLTFVCDYFAAEAFKRQHPLMGTQDPHSVDARDTEYLIGVEAWGDEIGHLEQSGADELIDRTLLPEHRQNATLMNIGKGGKSRSTRTRKATKESKKARAKAKAAAQAGRRAKFTDSKLASPTGMKTGYDN